MSKKIKHTVIWITIIGVLGSIAIGLIAMFIFDVDGEAVAYIIGSGAALTPVTIGAIVAAVKANEKKDNSKK